MENTNLHLCKCQPSVSDKSPQVFKQCLSIKLRKSYRSAESTPMLQYKNGNFDSVSLNEKIFIKQ